MTDALLIMDVLGGAKAEKITVTTKIVDKPQRQISDEITMRAEMNKLERRFELAAKAKAGKGLVGIYPQRCATGYVMDDFVRCYQTMALIGTVTYRR